MGKENPPVSLADALFSKVKQRVLGVFFSQPDRDFYASEIAEKEKTGRGALQRELERLVSSGLIKVTTRGRQRIYRANSDSPIFGELRGIVQKTIGVVEVLKNALILHANAIALAFVYGSVAKAMDTAESDVDLMVISDQLDYSTLYEILSPAEQTIGRKINPTLYSQQEFKKKIDGDNHFVTRVLEQRTLLVMGNLDDFRK